MDDVVHAAPFTLAQAAAPSWRPFLDPIDIHSSWFVLIVPLAFGVALAYKAVRVTDLKNLGRQTVVLALQIILGMIALGLGFYLFVNYLLPVITPRS